MPRTSTTRSSWSTPPTTRSAATPRPTGSATRCTSTVSCVASPRPARAAVGWARATGTRKPSEDRAGRAGAAATVCTCAVTVKLLGWWFDLATAAAAVFRVLISV
uniref:(northern house mosquito) hypothetical protein n=2 Tax=Culex pipiens TaxID=7175 RepID=A0A8D8BQQ3_CULPI